MIIATLSYAHDSLGQIRFEQLAQIDNFYDSC